MKETINIIQNRYCLRHAGGIYWLLDCGQEGLPYKEPIPLNEVGADIWRLLELGRTEEEVIEGICSAYGVDRDTVSKDVRQFMRQLLDVTGEI